MKACLTGSRVYGTPRFDSDLDCVVLVEDDNDYQLLHFSSDKRNGAILTNDGYNGVSLRFGNLNVIAVLRDEKVFEAWRKGTDFLKAIRPVTKEQACMVLETMFKVVKS